MSDQLNKERSQVASQVWEARYKQRATGRAIRDQTLDDTWNRVARAVSSVETSNQTAWERRFADVMRTMRFIPGGRIIAGAGVENHRTLFNCFVMGIPVDDPGCIATALREGAATLKSGGGVGYDFSSLRPLARPESELGVSQQPAVGSRPRGPVAYLHLWETMCHEELREDVRGGAMMATLSCDHPDIEAFIDAKARPTLLQHFNLSVLVSDAFLDAVDADAMWPLVFPTDEGDPTEEYPPPAGTVVRQWSTNPQPQFCRVYRRVRARVLWDHLLRAAFECGEPGVLFVDTINDTNNLWYRERLTATNPCGEVPLPAYGACNLGSLNLTQFVVAPFTEGAHFDFEALKSDVKTAVRLLDNVIDLSDYPLEAQRHEAQGSRRVGLGMTGLADALAMLNQRYDSGTGRSTAAEIARVICYEAYRTSIELAKEKGPFPHLETERFVTGHFVEQLPDDIRDGIRKHGIRNSHLLAIAPAGSISLLAGNVSSGIEPIFAPRFRRRIAIPHGHYRTFELTDYAYKTWKTATDNGGELPDSFVEAFQVSPLDHVKMQATIQRYVDNSISKTINLAAEASFDDFEGIFRTAQEMGLKGCTVFRAEPDANSVVVNLDTEIYDRDPRARACGGDQLLPPVALPVTEETGWDA